MEEISIMQGKDSAEQLVVSTLQSIGITINGNKPGDIQVHQKDFYSRILHQGDLGLGESYMEGWWDCQALDVFFEKILRAKLDEKVHIPFIFKIKHLMAKIINFQTKSRSKQVAKKHYDLGNLLFQAMLDSRMVYSCGYWKSATNLEEAQIAKLDLVCQKLQLQPGMKVLDIGCGWGGFAKYAAENYGVEVRGITISEQQYEYAKQYCAGLPVTIQLQDYRDIKGFFDRIVSIGMFEHVGYLNYATFMKVAHQVLNDDGLFLLHTIGTNIIYPTGNDWINKYIFPNGASPSVIQIAQAYEKYFIMEDWHNFGAYYDPTLMAWYQNFVRHWPDLKVQYDERFFRMWTYYLLSCAGSFRARTNQLWQIVLSKQGIPGGYLAPR